MQNFVHLHLHTEYSLLDGACPTAQALDAAKAAGMSACAITDHGVLYGAVDFYQAAKARGIKPILGCELYVCADMDEKRSASREYFHLIALCENQKGYENLVKLVSAGFTRGFYYKPRVDFALLEQYAEGLIATSACVFGEIPQAFLRDNPEAARQALARYQKIFGKDNFFLEIQDHGLANERTVLPQIVRLARETGTPLVATNDVHYIHKDGADAQEVLMCIQTGKTLEDQDRMRMETRELYFKTGDEMLSLFPQFPDALENTVKIAERCHVIFDFDTIHMPRYPLAQGESPLDFLVSESQAGLARLYPHDDGTAAERLRYEIDMISRMGYVDYFLIVWDFVRYARQQNIPVGPGRGSGAGSICAYCLGITGVDPLPYGLLFERFLNPERLSMPDFDIDFCYERRQEVIDYVIKRYGADHVAQIITFGTMAAKAVLRDVGRVLGYPYAEVDMAAKMVPFALDMTLEKALKMNPDFERAYENDPRMKRLVDTARQLEGMPRHASTHAAGVLITDRPVTDYVPLQKNDDVVTTQYPMGTLEKLGLLKMDFLGLRTLTVIQDTLSMLEKDGIHWTPEDIPLDDAPSYQMIAAGDTDGVFQLESGGMRTFLQNMKPETFEDIIAAISLYRPGPMESIPRYIEGRRNPAGVTYIDPQLKPILEVTFGCMVYQEQVMQIVRDLAGYSMGRSDLMRRAMSKKKKDVMEQERAYFIHGLVENGQLVVPGAVRNGVPEKAAAQIFHEMETFASYAFNKSHAAGYGVIAVQTAYLKRHHPAPFMAALLNSVSGSTGKIAQYIASIRAHRIALLKPDINRSRRTFSVEMSGGKPAIRFGMGAIKGCGNQAIDAMVEERERGGLYRDLFDFLSRVPGDRINKRVVEGLIRAGAMDGLQGWTRVDLMAVYDRAMDAATKSRKHVAEGQMSLFGGDDPQLSFALPRPNLKPYDIKMTLTMEKEVTGVYISGHPLDEAAAVLSALECNTNTLAELSEREDHGVPLDGQRVEMGGILVEVRSRVTKAGALMGIATLEDLTGQVECLIFPKAWERIGKDMTVERMVLLSGRLSLREEEEPKLVIEAVKELTTAQGSRKLFVRLPERTQIDPCRATLLQHPGNVPVYFRIESEGVTLQAPETLWITPGEALLSQLTAQWGTSNIKMVEGAT